MRTGPLLAGALLALACHAGAALARNQLGGRDAVVVDPQKSYIFFRSHQRLPLRLLREVSPAQRTAWEQQRARALQRARGAYPGRLREWQRLQAECRGSQAPACLNRDTERPVEPTEASFTIPPPELDNFLDISAGPQFTRDGDDYTYLMTVDPGTYIVYGQIVVTSQAGGTGICLCMGSVRFEAPAGRIVDLGELRYPIAEALAAGQTVTPGISPLTSHAIVPATDAMARPDRLAGLPVVPAGFRAADKMPNYFGVQISRLAAMPGILGYDRDRVIDLTTNGPAAP